MRTGLALLTLAALTAAREQPNASVEIYLSDKAGIGKERFVAAVLKALDEEGLDAKALPREYAKAVDGSFSYHLARFRIEKGQKNRYEDPVQAAAEALEPAAQVAIREHKAWLALEAADSEPFERRQAVLCRIAAELLGDDVIAIRLPARDAWFSAKDDGLAEKLRSEDPLAALGVPLTEAERRERAVAQLRVEASKEARDRLDDFRKAFRDREKTGARDFTVAFKDVKGEENVLLVNDIHHDDLKGLANVLGGVVPREWTVSPWDVLDWSYRVGKTVHGNFREAAVKAYDAKSGK